MVLAGEKVGIPSADEAPMIVMAQYKQPIAGFLSILIVFIISWITWLIFFDPRWHNPYPTHEMEITAWATVIGGFGLIGVVWAIWFENWPYYGWFRTPWKVGLVGTAINIVIALIFSLLLLPWFTSFYSNQITDPYVAWFVGASIFGALMYFLSRASGIEAPCKSGNDRFLLNNTFTFLICNSIFSLIEFGKTVILSLLPFPS